MDWLRVITSVQVEIEKEERHYKVFRLRKHRQALFARLGFVRQLRKFALQMIVGESVQCTYRNAFSHRLIFMPLRLAESMQGTYRSAFAQ